MANETTARQGSGGVLFYFVVLLLAYLVYRIFAPFLVALAWAGVLVVVSYPAYEWLARRWGRSAAAAAAVAGVTLALIVPGLLAMIAFVREGVETVQSIHLGFEAGHFQWLSDLWARIQQRFPAAATLDLTSSLHRYAEQAAGYVGMRLGMLARNTAVFLFHLCVTILAMFYLFRDGPAILARLRDLLPFDAPRREQMLGRARDLIFASVTSTLAGAVTHGILGGLAFSFAGIRAPVFWGVMMGFSSLVPVVGTALIWIPISASLLLEGRPGRAVLLAILCLVIVGVVDNVFRPWLMSGRGKLSGLLVFVGVLGGIGVFGMLGIVLGPIVVATAASVLDLYTPHAPDGNNLPLPDSKKPGGVLE